MNKKLSRIAAIALSAAMVTSAFAMSTSSAFAATAVTITPAPVIYNATYTGTAANDQLTLATVFTGLKADVAADKDSKPGVAFTANAGSYKVASGNAKLSSDGTKLELTGTGDVVVTGTAKMDSKTTLETVKHNHTEDFNADQQTFTATVHVYKNNAVMVLPTSVGDAAHTTPATTDVKNNEEIGFNDTEKFGIYKVGQTGTGDATATFTADTTTLAAANDLISSNNDLVPLKDVAPATGVITSAAQDKQNYKTGFSIISAKASGIQSYTVKVADYYHATAALAPTVKTTLGVGTQTLSDDGYDITGKTVKADSTVTVSAKGANLGDVTATGAVTISAGTVKSVVGSDAVTISTASNMGDVVVGDVKAAKAVKVTGADTANSDKTFNTVTVGNITSSAAAGAAADIALKTTEDNTKKTIQGVVKVGNVTTKDGVTVETTKDVTSLTTGTINGVVGNYADCPYTATFKLINGNFKTNGDLKYMGAVTVDTTGATATGDAKGAKLTTGAIDTGTYADGAAASGAYGYTYDGATSASASAVAVTTADADLVADSIKVQKAPTANAGNITVKSNSFSIMDSNPAYTDAAPAAASGATLYISDLAKGSVLYTGSNHLEKVFNIPGVTTNKAYDQGKGVYNYKAEAVQFLGFTLNQTQMKLAKNESKTIVASPIPSGALETGVTIAWTANKDTVKLTPSADTLSCAVASTGYTDANVNDGNNVVVTAVLMKNGIAYTPFNSDKATGTCNVTLTNDVSAPVLTTTVTDLDGKIQPVTADTVIKMTQSTYNTVNFAADKAGIADIKYGTGDGTKAQTGTTSAWNGTAGKYTIYASGKVGDKVGVFANGVKVFQIEIVDRPFKCDTTLDLDGVKGKALTVGQKYSFKITPADGTKIDTFTFLTANDSAVASWGFVKNADGTVTATIKALKATDKIGVYAKINGVTYKVFAAAVK